MTITDVGILLIVLCIVLWAIMAALHRHTVQLETLKTQMEALLKAQQAAPDVATTRDSANGQDDNVEDLAAHTANTASPLRRTFPK